LTLLKLAMASPVSRRLDYEQMYKVYDIFLYRNKSIIQTNDNIYLLVNLHNEIITFFANEW